MDNFDQQQVRGASDTDQTKKRKTKCLMCEFVLIFSFAALLLVLASIFLVRIPFVNFVGT